MYILKITAILFLTLLSCNKQKPAQFYISEIDSTSIKPTIILIGIDNFTTDSIKIYTTKIDSLQNIFGQIMQGQSYNFTVSKVKNWNDYEGKRNIPDLELAKPKLNSIEDIVKLTNVTDSTLITMSVRSHWPISYILDGVTIISADSAFIPYRIW